MERKFTAGDRVILTNDYGVKIRGVKTILSTDTSTNEPRYFIAPTDTPWFSVPEYQLTAEIDFIAKQLWEKDYPNGGSLYKTYESTPHHDKELYRKDAQLIINSQGATP